MLGYEVYIESSRGPWQLVSLIIYCMYEGVIVVGELGREFVGGVPRVCAPLSGAGPLCGSVG